MAYSIQRDVSNGSLQYLEVRIDYFAKEHLSVFIAEKIVPQGTTPDPTSGYCWTWDGNRIKFNKAVANGLEVMVRRATPIAAPFHIFRQGAVFKDLTVDENFLQQLYINQENQEGQTTTDFYSDLNFHGYRLRNVGAAIHDYDAVPFSQYRADALGAMQQRILAEQARDTAVSAKDTSVTAKTAAEAARDAALVSQNAAKTSETNAKASEVAAGASANSAANSATASANSATAAKADADRAKASADSIDLVVLNQKIDGAISKNATQDTDIANLKVEVKKAQRPMFSVEWWGGLRSAIPAGAVPADGQVLSASVYPEADAAIRTKLYVPVANNDSDLDNQPTAFGFYTTPNSTSFRVPDYNGKRSNSLGAVFMRGDGKNSAGGVGLIQGDAIRNITGTMTYQFTPASAVASGVFGTSSPGNDSTWSSGAAGTSRATTTFDASRVVPTANENRPVAATGCWIIWLFGSVTNAGSADAAALATAYAALAGRISAAESKLAERKSTCLVNAVGTGAPHETVSAALPANVVADRRYVLENPFGANVPVLVQVEVFVNGVWANPGHSYVGASPGSYGAIASYVQGVGIVVQTGSGIVCGLSRDMGGGHGNTTTNVSSAPCRVFVRKMEA